MPKRQGFTGVTMLARQFIPIYINGQQKKFISPHLSSSRESAIIEAIFFAANNDIPYEGEFLPNKPFIVLIKKGDIWHPAELGAYRVTRITEVGGRVLNGTREMALIAGHIYSQITETDFIPSIIIPYKD